MPRWSTVVALIGLLPALTRADDVVHVLDVLVDRPTVISLGLQVTIAGDDDHDARIDVRFRPSGAPAWRDGLPLFRVHPEDVVGLAVPEQFAGSLFELAPATTYDVELHVTDPDGPVDQTTTVQATTRAIPGDPAHPDPKLVSDAVALQAALDAAQPGDVITVAPGTYRGSFTIAASGTATDPIVVRGADGDQTILDGRDCQCNLFEIDGSFVHLERLTLQNAERGVRFKTTTEGNVVRRVHVRDVVIGMIGDPDQRDYYLCDNVLEGRLVWPHVYGDDGGRHASDDGINVKGDGHVVCHNDLIGFGDALKVEQDGARADDFYGNEVRSAYDNGIELDTSAGNTRCFRNRFTNTFVPLSFQPIYGGPVYALRNVVVNVAEDQLKFYSVSSPTREPSGMLVLHNTFVSPVRPLLMGSTATSHHFLIADNLFVGPASAGPVVADWTGPIDDGTIDHDGWFPDGTFDFHGAGSWTSFAAMQTAGAFESHGTLLDASTFASGLVAPASYTVTMTPPDASLADGTPAVDRALPFPNLSDIYTGAGPDLGALETGCPSPLYGVRPEGIDETDEPYGCGGPTITTTTSTTSTTLPWTTIRTKALQLRDPAGGFGRRLTFTAKTKLDPTANRITPPAPGGPGDPTLAGATVTVYNAAGSGEQFSASLPASNPVTGAGWVALGRPPGARGYRFRDPDPAAAISSVKVQPDTITVKGGGATFGFTLDEPAQTRVGVQLRAGTGRPWCAEAPARANGIPPSTAASDHPGLFVAQPGSPPPAACEMLP